MRDKIIKLLDEKGDLPPLPDIVLKLQKMIKDPQKSIKDIAMLIEYDPVMAGKIIKLSNSAYYARSQIQIKTLPVAVSKIGLNMLLKLVYSLKISSLFSTNSLLNNSQFWQHSLGVAIFTQSLSIRVKATQNEQDISYLAGLMHDIGIMVFIYLIPSEYNDFLKKATSIKKPLEVQEYETFGIDHAELGGKFIEKWWNMDKEIVSGVANHNSHFREAMIKHKSEQIIHVANSICNDKGMPNGTNCFTETFEEDSWNKLGLSLDDVDSILKDVDYSLEQAEELVSFSFK
jgi:HD-like signal output (HDOD) protein